MKNALKKLVNILIIYLVPVGFLIYYGHYGAALTTIFIMYFHFPYDATKPFDAEMYRDKDEILQENNEEKDQSNIDKDEKQ